MEQKQLARFKKILLDEKQRVINSSRRNLDDLKVQPEDMADEADLAATELNQNLAFSLRDRERVQLVTIDQALDRINGGTFGVCIECEDPIELKRLEARPMSTLCFSCQEAEEHKAKVFA